jgi:hypothetical protein
MAGNIESRPPLKVLNTFAFASNWIPSVLEMQMIFDAMESLVILRASTQPWARWKSGIQTIGDVLEPQFHQHSPQSFFDPQDCPARKLVFRDNFYQTDRLMDLTNQDGLPLSWE